MVKIDIKNIALGAGLSFLVLTILNLLLHEAFNQIPIVKSGKAIILILASIAIVMLFVFAADKQFDKSEIFMFILILITIVAIFYITKKYIPELYSVFPDSLKDVGGSIITWRVILGYG